MPVHSENRYVTKLYLTLLIDAARDIQHILLVGTSEQAWDSVKTLVMLIREKKERPNLDRFVVDTEKEIARIRSYRGYTISDTLPQRQLVDVYRKDRSRQLYDKCLAVLDQFHYLEAAGLKPTVDQDVAVL